MSPVRDIHPPSVWRDANRRNSGLALPAFGKRRFGRKILETSIPRQTINGHEVSQFRRKKSKAPIWMISEMPRTRTPRLRQKMAVLWINRDSVKPKIDHGIAAAVRHYENMAKALSFPFNPISRNKHVVLDAECGKAALRTRNEIASARTLRLINRVRQPNGRNAPQCARLGIDVNDMNPLGMRVFRVASDKANHPISPARKVRRQSSTSIR